MYCNKKVLLFDIKDLTPENFETHALQLFRYQYDHVPVYRQFVDLLKADPGSVTSLHDIPFLPVMFFKSHQVIADALVAEVVFESSTTTGSVPSRHFVADINLYVNACVTGFERVYGKLNEWCFLALLPSYLERGNSSLIRMVNEFMQRSNHPHNNFYLKNHVELSETVLRNEAAGQKTMVIGVSYALLDWAEFWNRRSTTVKPPELKHITIMETGGMKGRRREMVKAELHDVLKKTFKVDTIHSEYGMTELLSQAYSTGNGIYRCPPWMRVLLRDVNDPLRQAGINETGVINVIDLANQYSCAFIATDDLGRIHGDGSFEVPGRLDASEMRGCNLLVE